MALTKTRNYGITKIDQTELLSGYPQVQNDNADAIEKALNDVKKFATDSIPKPATTESDGLMTKEDKDVINRIVNASGTSGDIYLTGASLEPMTDDEMNAMFA